MNFPRLTALLALAILPAMAHAGAPETIKIGNTMPYSGPASAYGQIGETLSACFRMVNDQGGINGRQVEFISYDDAYSPPKTVEQVRKLVERDKVLFIAQILGTPTNSAVHAYLNNKGIPQLFVAAGASKWGDPENFPWTMGWHPSYRTEAKVYAQYILENLPDARIAILYQNDDYGMDYLTGFKAALGQQRADEMIVAELPYETSDLTVDSRIISAKASGADVFLDITTPKFAAQAIRKAHQIGWDPVHFLNNVSISVDGVLEPAGLEASQGLISAGYLINTGDPRWQDTEDYRNWAAFMDKYYPEGDRKSTFTTYGYAACMTLVEVLRRAGDDLSRENIMEVATHLTKVDIPMLLPGIYVDTSPTDYFPIEAMQLQRFKGESWHPFGEVISAETE